MQTIGDRIRARREHLGWTQAKLAELLNIKVGTLSGYERNYRMPDARMLQLLSAKMDVTSDYLLGLSQSESIPTKRVIPLVGTIHAGLPLLAEENFDGYLEVPDYIQTDYALQVKGDDMVGAGILDGDLALCCQADTINSNQIAVVLNALGGRFYEAALKCFGYENERNPGACNFNDSVPEANGQGRIIGVMVALVRKNVIWSQPSENSLIANNNNGWAEVMSLAIQAGLNARQVREILAGQIEISKRLHDI